MDLNLLQSFLFWSFILNTFILLVWFIAFVLARDFIYNLHTKWFALSNEEFDSTHYKAMAFWKLSVFLFNLV
ncbi:MAG: hypothetical protein GX780_07665, partial [Campylobacteraceae bacterium]|nr:hypothetical protein [Campylobacteraceae bacterium]